MRSKYVETVGLFKALSDVNRLMILDMLSCGELCACKILEKFSITQPTLSHHMKILCDCGLVKVRKDGKWSYYSLNDEAMQAFKTFLRAVAANCICKEDDCIFEGSKNEQRKNTENQLF